MTRIVKVAQPHRCLIIAVDASLNDFCLTQRRESGSLKFSINAFTISRKDRRPSRCSPTAPRVGGRMMDFKKIEISSLNIENEKERPTVCGFGATHATAKFRTIFRPRCPQRHARLRIKGKNRKNNAAIYHGLSRVSRRKRRKFLCYFLAAERHSRHFPALG